MRKIYILAAMALCVFGVNAQDITVFDFDATTPTFSSWADTFEGVPNPASDATNGSVNVGKYTHKGAWSTVSAAVDIDPRINSSFDIDVYSPSEGTIVVACYDANDKQLMWYSQAVVVLTGWTKFSKELDFTTKIAKVAVSFNNDKTPAGTAADVVYFDNLIFKNRQVRFSPFTVKLFMLRGVSGVIGIGAPSTQAGKWFGRIDLSSEGDGAVNIKRDWDAYAHNLNVSTISPWIEIAGINIQGFENFRLVFDNKWPYSDAENAGFSSATDAEKTPAVEYKSGSGAWTVLAASAFTGNWQTQTLSIDGIDDQHPLSIRFSKTGYSYRLDNVKIQGSIKPTSTGLGSETNEKLVIYPNPARDYIVIPEAQSVTIINFNGQIVKEISNAEKMDVSDLMKGVYVVKVQIDNITRVSKLIKE